ncbi:type I polyketide synthase [Dyella sp. GSA-30]|uniref:type I polyketide synthase n=1 Tax=Dyella sp. GSA-30 TaxID=2994496 RepID=UPI0024938096|nr:type I polyketide synthase [Dyella sp. GSA-30]BDU18884.1 polyketide synthase [Dyella sp. GSA-30]
MSTENRFQGRSDIVIGLTPLEQPDTNLTLAICRTGAIGVLDLGTDPAVAEKALIELRDNATSAFGIRIGRNFPPAAYDSLLDTLPPDTLVLLSADADTGVNIARSRNLAFACEVRGLQEALNAQGSGAIALIARGDESGGCSSQLSTFILLQTLVSNADIHLPIWACGGIGLRTAAAALVAGAAGVVLDIQLALLEESHVPLTTRHLLDRIDGAETTREGEYRLIRPKRSTSGTSLIAGQDAYLARIFARRFGNVPRTFAAFRNIRRQLQLAEPGRPSGLCETLGTRIPVLQGPMTRVSDQAAFASSVAAAGALPFVALALLDGPASLELLRQCQQQLGDQPWGVGILGFADEAIRQAQLDAIVQIRPSHAIIAGGRPAQALALEALGITTFVHVPSPGLLTQFLDAGVRRFIFEGAECGGHIGPRNSFPLWESQLDIVESQLAQEQGKISAPIELVFAGGIHDAASASAVMAMTAGMANQLIRTGILMGTAYLFTEEAVRHGAIGQLFQQQLLLATGTRLLETAPGHATRCLSTPFVDEFQRCKNTWLKEGKNERDIWSALEQLNLGRLRLASKGLRREGGSLKQADDAAQLSDGMFMAGDISLLRSKTSTLHQLHEEVTRRATEWFSQNIERMREPAVEHASAPEPYRVAIVGIACAFAGSENVGAFWQRIIDASPSFTDIPSSRWNADRYHGNHAISSDRVASRRGAFIDPVEFDALSYGIPPASMATIEPIQLLSLEMAQRALAHAGYGKGGFDRSRTAVIFGAEAGSELRDALTLRAVLPTYIDSVPDLLQEQLPRFTEDTFPGMLSNVIAGRIASRLDLGGGNFTVDAACASSLAALDMACKELRLGHSDMVLCGGADLHNGISDYMMFNSAGALSPSGRSLPFDAHSDGIVLGEGIACLVLKRVEDAQRDGDRIYSVIEAIGSASDGRGKGLTAPRPEGQQAALRRAYAQAQRSPAEVGLVEAHGTGTAVGDRTELSSLSRVLDDASAAPGHCVLGSVKSLIGHTKCAAGLAGIIKASLALHTGIRPPTTHITTPSAAWPSEGALRLQTVAQPWLTGGKQRVAGVSAFGFGGTNFHTVLSNDAVMDVDPSLAHRPCELILIRGASRNTANSVIDRLLEMFATQAPLPALHQVTSDVFAQSDQSQPAHFAFVARDIQHFTSLLRSAREGLPIAGELYIRNENEAAPEKLAFLFPGQGSQRPNMLRELPTFIPGLRRYLASEPDIADAWFTGHPFDDDARARQINRLKDTRVAQPALGIASMMAARALEGLGVTPDMAAGHSYGELVAFWSAGAIDEHTLLTLSKQRAQCIHDAIESDPGAMAAVAASPAIILPLLAVSEATSDIVCANHNAPDQTVISGPTTAISAACALLKAQGVGVRPLAVACAFHSPIVASASAPFRDLLAKVAFSPLRHQVWSNRLATPHAMDASTAGQELAAQIAHPVRFVDQILAMHDAGARTFIEVGPGNVLCGLTRAILGGRKYRALSIDPHGDGTLAGLLQTVAALAVAGVAINESWLLQGRTCSRTPERAGCDAKWLVDGHFVRTADGMPLAGGLKPTAPIPSLCSPASPRTQELSTDVALIEQFIQSTSDAIASQRDVLLQHLGSRPEAPRSATIDQPIEAASAGLAHAKNTPENALAKPVRADTSTDSIAEMITRIIAERTGYPTDVLTNDLDLESDLSIDSIKRAEIVGHVLQSLKGRGMAQANDVHVADALAQARTISAMCEIIAIGDDANTISIEEPVDISQADVLETVIQAICERTGYPSHAVTADLDIESDLSIDSIKRAEIAGHLAQAFSITTDTARVDALTAARTPSAMASVLQQGATPQHTATDKTGASTLEGIAPTRLIERLEAIPALASDGRLHWRNMYVVSSPTTLLEAIARRTNDATVCLVPNPLATVTAAHTADWIIDTGSLAPSEFPAQYDTWKGYLAAEPRRLIAICRSDDAVLCASLRGFFRCAAREYPSTTIRLVELDAQASDDYAASIALAELCDDSALPVVVYQDSSRLTPVLAESALPQGAGVSESRNSTWLLIGGARGITGLMAKRLAAGVCRIVLVGRTDDCAIEEDESLINFSSINALRGAILAHKMANNPPEATRMAKDILARREVRQTIDAIEALGCRVSYHKLDITEDAGIDTLLADVERLHGPIHGIVHAAGIIEDRLIADKDNDSFKRVWSAKMDGARKLIRACERLKQTPDVLVMFGSIAAMFGNRGQSDYAAANSALDALTRECSPRVAARVITMHWGPWAPLGEGQGGMVSPELAKQFAAQDIAMIQPDAGVDAFFAEINISTECRYSVVYSAGSW